MSTSGEKRAASPTPVGDAHDPKKQKAEVGCAVVDTARVIPVAAPAEMPSSPSAVSAAPLTPATATAHVETPPTPASSSPLSESAQKQTAAAATPAAGKKKASKNPDVKSLFTPWEPNITIPPFNDAWGRKPCPGQEGPKSHPDEPAARTSNAQTKTPLWEDRKWRFKKGNRYVKSFRKGEHIPDDAPDLDQEDNLVLHLIDMRAKNRRDPTPRRTPVVYYYENGLPKDWNNKQTVKALNDRRQQAIDRITMDPPWANYERQYLASLLQEFPDASILELTERFNYRFMGNDFAKSTAFEWDYISAGRTIESVRHEYLMYKHMYDQGDAPNKKELEDKSKEGLAARKARSGIPVKDRLAKFGKKDKNLDKDDEDSDAEGDEEASDAADTPKKTPRKKAIPKKKAQQKEMDIKNGVPAPTEQPEMGAEDEELLHLAGFYSARKHSETSGPKRSPTPRSPAIAQEIDLSTIEKTKVEFQQDAHVEEGHAVAENSEPQPDIGMAAPANVGDDSDDEL
ncbi:hypothetical protein BU26DRAFT_109144 [Trematosphaeria pertusa]|uniref:Uncharacterized protein n=1 Tax=Trematosphaeria pertusa TaxID=390896 RepID=A0A6A6I0I0_9PLEO|nr:uncharacterized protein BU26DRAFT_109144 [Trematosphaeria pertusa]KAF2243786.1 hypothetical protein BU26DRAFT_109144 [Trematosphaeria pertusa]